MSPSNLPRALIEVAYAEYAREYLRSLPPEHFMEATAQATQRKITLESLDLVHARRPEVQVFNELLVQYPKARQRRPGQVVPDNMVVVCNEPIQAAGSYDTPLQPVGPFWTLEYVSKFNRRKDYEDSFKKYERDIKVPYYLAFYPDNQELTLFHLRASRYRSVPPDEQGRHGIAELDLEVGLRDGWVRFWYQGELLPLPADLQRDLDETRRQLRNEKRRAEREKHRADQEKERAEQEKHRAEQEQARAEEAARQAADLRRRLEEEQQARAALERELHQRRSREAPPPTRPRNGR
jgi:Uma2 family endonuclease